jgi:imidazolonepropionase-like amidohydrolase
LTVLPKSLIVSLLFVAASVQAQSVLLRGGHVIPVSGAEMDDADVLIRDGRIVAVGKDLAADGEALVLDVHGRVVMPAFVIPHTSEGMDRSNEMVPVTPFLSILDSMDPSRPFFEDCLRDGNYTIAVMPGEMTIIGGTGALVKPRGLTVEDMLIERNAGMKLSLMPANGNRAAHLAKLRAALDDAKRYMEDQQAKHAGASDVFDMDAFQMEQRRRELVRMLRAEIPAWIACATAADVDQALKLEADYKLDVRLVLGNDTWRAFPRLKGRKLPVILAGDFQARAEDPETGKEVVRNLPQLLKAAGVSFAVTTAPGALARRYMWYQAASLVRCGLTREEALLAVTKNAAQAAGLGAKKGALEAGYDGDVLVLTEDPLSGKAWVDTGLIGGKVVYERSKDPRLSEIFGRGR